MYHIPLYLDSGWGGNANGRLGCWVLLVYRYTDIHQDDIIITTNNEEYTPMYIAQLHSTPTTSKRRHYSIRIQQQGSLVQSTATIRTAQLR